MLSHYLAFSVRNLRRTPFVSVLNVLTLAIGLVCFMTAYAFVTFFERADRQFANADRTHIVTTSFTFFGGQFSREQSTRTPEHLASQLLEDFPAIEAIARAFELDWQARTAVSSGDRAVRLHGVAADAAFLEIFDLAFLAGDPRSALAAPRSIVLTRDSARQLFGDANPVGRPLRIRNLVDATVTGVIDALPEPSHIGRSRSAILRLEMLASVDVYETIRAETLAGVESPAEAPPLNWLGEDAVTYLLLPEDGSLPAAELEDRLPGFVARHAPAELAASFNLRFDLLPIGALLRKGVDTELFSGDIGVSVTTVFSLLGTLVLVVACINYANLAAARAAGRTREVGLRKAVGARPAQITAQHLLEAALLSVTALVIAVAGLRWSLPMLERLAGLTPGATHFGVVDTVPVLLVVATTTTLVAGAYPAFVLARTGAHVALRRPQGARGGSGLTRLLVGVQFAVASLLLITVIILALQNARLERLGLGAAGASLVLIENERDVTHVETSTLHAALLALPQVEAVTAMGGLPWQRLVAVTTLSRAAEPASPTHRALVRDVGPDFFAVMRMNVLAGRVFTAEDTADQRNIVVDRAFVDELGFASPEAAVDQFVYGPASGDGTGADNARRIIGVVETRRFSLRGAGAVATMFPLGASPSVTAVRIATEDIRAALAGIDAVWRDLAPDVAISRRFMDELFDEAYERFVSIHRAVGGLVAMALLIATGGLFAMATLVAARRRAEVGVRKTFGASTAAMVLLLLRGFTWPVLIANVVSWPIAWVGARAYLGAFVDPIELTLGPFASALAVTLLIAWIAVAGQTLSAARTAPARVLRSE